MKTPIFVLDEPQDRHSTAKRKRETEGAVDRDNRRDDDGDNDNGDDVGGKNGEGRRARRARDMQLIHVSRCCEWMNAARRDTTATIACDSENSKNLQTSEERHRRLFPDDTRLGRRSVDDAASAVSKASYSRGGLSSDTGRKVQHLLDSLFFYWFDFDDDDAASVDARIPRLGCAAEATIWACAWRDFDRLRNLHPTFDGQRRAAIRGILWLCAGDDLRESHKEETDAILHQLFNSEPTGAAFANIRTNANEGVMMTISNLMVHVMIASTATGATEREKRSMNSTSSLSSTMSKPVMYVRDTLLGMYVWGCGFDRTLADAIYAIMGYQSFASRWDGTSLPYIAPSNYWNARERNSANRHWRGWRDDIKAAFSERRDRCRRYAQSYNFGLETISRFIQVTHLLWGHPEHYDVPLQFWLHYWKHRDDPIVTREMRSALDSHRAHLGHICTHLDAAANFETPPTELVESIMRELMHVAIVCRRCPDYADLATDGLCAIFESRPLRWHRSRSGDDDDDIAKRDEADSNTLERFHAVIDAMRRSGHLKEARELFRRVESGERPPADRYDWSERCGNVVGPYAGRFSSSSSASPSKTSSPPTSSEILRGLPLHRHPPRSHILNMTHSAWAMWRKWLPPDIADMPAERVDLFRVDEVGSVYVEMGRFGLSAITTMSELVYAPRSRSAPWLDTIVERLSDCEGRFLQRCRQMHADVDSSPVKKERATRTIARMRTGVLSHLVVSVWGESAFAGGPREDDAHTLFDATRTTGLAECISRYLDSLHAAPAWKRRHARHDIHRSRELGNGRAGRRARVSKKAGSKKRGRPSSENVEEEIAAFANRERGDSMDALTTGLLHLYLCAIHEVPPMGVSIGETRSSLVDADFDVHLLARFSTPEFRSWLRSRAESTSNPPRFRYLPTELVTRWETDATASASSPYALAIQNFIRACIGTSSKKVADSLADARLNGDAERAIPKIAMDSDDARFPIFTHPLYAFVNTRSCADHPLWTPYTEVFEAVACDEDDRELSRVLL
ncbi:hypothetical protein CYMTET_3265 [Cymbomonas tetramitiformis]|uniref:Uncharacterized protein n=1 Tax=Cymbomonas tetramitiformis TaxID=36881 RepID=A0AAE0H3N0_9CHLO|nr:hypothetical protein CYMTET_3265 [Cymbomonas tetramitiformis]